MSQLHFILRTIAAIFIKILDKGKLSIFISLNKEIFEVYKLIKILFLSKLIKSNIVLQIPYQFSDYIMLKDINLVETKERVSQTPNNF